MRKKLADKIREMDINQLFKYFSRVEWYLLMDGDDSVFEELAEDYNINYSTLETLWQQAIVQIDKKKNITFTQIKKLILKTFHKTKYITQIFENELKSRYSEICDKLGLNYISIEADPTKTNNIPADVKKYISQKVLDESNYYKDLLVEKNKFEKIIKNF